MFWKKKQSAAVGVGSGGMGAAVSETAGKPASHLKVVKEKGDKLPGPRLLPGFVQKYLVERYSMDSGLANIIMGVRHPRPESEGISDCRIFDNSEAEALGLKVHDFDSLNDRPDLILFEGWFDEHSKKVDLTEKRTMDNNVPLLTESEILQKIEALNEPGSTVYFYQSRGPNVGGPLGRGVAIVELNPDYEKAGKGKKYNICASNAFRMEPCGKRAKVWDSNKSKDIAKWIRESHTKRSY
jgi:hypothetical protein